MKGRKILGICGSPRHGNTEWMVRKILTGAEQEGAMVRLFLLQDSHIEQCDGCLTCEDTGRCHLSDDFDELYEEISSSDGIVLGTPVRFDAVSPQVKNFIDRLNPLCNKLHNKRLAIAIVGQLSGSEGSDSRRRVRSYLERVAQIFEMRALGSVEGVAKGPGEVSVDKGVEAACIELGRRIARE